MNKATTTAAIVCSIFAYDNFLVISVDQDVVDSLSDDELLAKVEGEGWTFRDTATTLGISPEAIELMSNLSATAEGESVDLRWDEADGGTFNYNGAPHAFFHPEQARVSADWAIRGYVEIENDVPQAAIDAMDLEEVFEEIEAALEGDDETENEQQVPVPPVAL